MVLFYTVGITIPDSYHTNKFYGCKVNGLPIGVPFKSTFFIPKGKRSFFTENACTFIIAPVSLPESTSVSDQYTGTTYATDELNDNENNDDDESSIEVKYGSFKSDEENHQEVDCTFESGALSDQQIDSPFESGALSDQQIDSRFESGALSESVKKEPEELEVTPDETQNKKRHASDDSNDSGPSKRIKMKSIEDELQDDGHKQSRRSSRFKDLGYRPDYLAIEAEYEEYDSDATVTAEYDSDTPYTDLENEDNIIIKKEIEDEDVSTCKMEADEGNTEIEHCHQIKNKIKKSKQKGKSAKRDSDQDLSLQDDAILDEENHSKEEHPHPIKNKKKETKQQSRPTKRDSDPDFSLSDDAKLDEENHSKEKHRHQNKNKKKKTKQKSKPTKRGGDPGDVNSDDENLSVKSLKINLVDHTDKYREEILPSYQRKDRGKAMEDVSMKLLTCTVCEKFKTEDLVVLENHIGKHIRGELSCEFCDFVASYRRDLCKHRREVHKQNILLCPECGKDISNGTKGMKNHLGKEHDSPQWECSHCTKKGNLNIKFITSELLRKHVEKDHPETFVPCNECKRLFHSQYHLQNHLKGGCEGNMPPTCYPCEKCGKSYTSQMQVTRHIEQVHSKVRKFQCPQCPFATTAVRQLENHVHTHSGYHPYHCDQCSFSCVQRFQLKSHMRTHTGEKPYKCTKCNYAAAWKVQLKEHEKVHSLGNTITCVKCDIVFKDQRGLKIHEKKEHPGEETE